MKLETQDAQQFQSPRVHVHIPYTLALILSWQPLPRQWSLCPAPSHTCTLGFMILPRSSQHTKKSGPSQTAILPFYFNCNADFWSCHSPACISNTFLCPQLSCPTHVLWNSGMSHQTSTNLCLSISFIHPFIHSLCAHVCPGARTRQCGNQKTTFQSPFSPSTLLTPSLLFLSLHC